MENVRCLLLASIIFGMVQTNQDLHYTSQPIRIWGEPKELELYYAISC